MIEADSSVRIVARFDGAADPQTPSMFRCPILRHEDRGMMGQFVVIEPGTEQQDRITDAQAARCAVTRGPS